MKRIFRKNQLVITALAFMIAVAGYFSYMNNNADIQTAGKDADVGALEEDYEISDEELAVDDIFIAEEDPSDAETAGTDTAAAQETAMASDTENVADGETGADNVDNPGEAVLTGTTVANLDYASEMK